MRRLRSIPPSIRPRDIIKNALLVAATCALAGPATPAAGDSPAGTRQYWEEHCASCHGVEGKADTKAGKKIGAINFTDPQNQAKFTDDQMFKAIKEGVKNKSGKYTMKPAENASDELIYFLVAYVPVLQEAADRSAVRKPHRLAADPKVSFPKCP